MTYMLEVASTTSIMQGIFADCEAWSSRSIVFDIRMIGLLVLISMQMLTYMLDSSLSEDVTR